MLVVRPLFSRYIYLNTQTVTYLCDIQNYLLREQKYRPGKALGALLHPLCLLPVAGKPVQEKLTSAAHKRSSNKIVSAVNCACIIPGWSPRLFPGQGDPSGILQPSLGTSRDFSTSALSLTLNSSYSRWKTTHSLHGCTHMCALIGHKGGQQDSL